MTEQKLPEGFDPSFKINKDLKINPKEVLDVTGKPLKYGKDPKDTHLIGADDTPSFEMRNFDDYPDIPIEVKHAEIKYILPMANFISKTLGITVIDEKMYDKVINALKSRSLFVVLNIQKVKIQAGIADWFGLIVTCKKHPIVLVKFKLQLSTGKIGIIQYRIWNAELQNYKIIGDPQQKKFLNREEVSTGILEYLNREGVCRV